MSTKVTAARIVQPYLSFEGRCEEAVEFYRRALGAQVEMMMRFSDSPEPSAEGCAGGPKPPGDKIMHCSFRVGDSVLMASDGMCSGKSVGDGISLSYTVPTVEESQRIFAALSEGGKVEMPLASTFFSPSFGIVSDRFGVSWMVHVTPPQPQ